MADRGPPDLSSGSNSDPGKPADRSGAGIEAIVDRSDPIIVNPDSINPIQKEPISAHNFYNRHKKRFWTIGAILACIAVISSLAATRNVSTRSKTDVAGSSTSTPTPTATSTNLSQESSPRVGSALAFSSRVDANSNFDGQLIYQSKSGELWTRYYNESSGGFGGYNYPLSAEIKSGTPLSSIFWDDNGKN
ncbi:hypothetical protein BDD12DRAFT_800432 [Trichophaea hybrida]|nr:hypothetical protein BDD12DRAFT_800432 [Trichophaea hybrida]